MDISQAPLAGVFVIKPQRFEDERGYFSEVWNRHRFEEAGLSIDFVQDNQSLSRRSGTVRGLHYQLRPHAQDKLVRVVHGRILDVAVDLRRDSPTFGRWFAIELSADNQLQLLVPKGFAHGFVTREPDTQVAYKCSHTYAPASDRAIRYDDPAIGIDWGLGAGEAILSPKDAAAPLLADVGELF
ncbi:dTDP-4-dehydrorhamnose 3,5-epimerase [Devosia enhydra]|uniref:dTDP-4-dehydrorhamnose 3,5-epimerase n=1 Tax=Devosia enhydra TaxID=665118 RepID=A0A1K2HS49_9HYPH|nr:dTDP-4-dehydrorhamnose 3,5-epimerase [Devosia enhydra]SFZ80663.1 dTDP-4-dehydrorhamnose 3,5-epimerase [Devosia enhydra]